MFGVRGKRPGRVPTGLYELQVALAASKIHEQPDDQHHRHDDNSVEVRGMISHPRQITRSRGVRKGRGGRRGGAGRAARLPPELGADLTGDSQALDHAIANVTLSFCTSWTSVTAANIRDVSTEQWTFIGVVIGAVLAGGLALMKELVVARTARGERLSAERRDAYLTATRALRAYRATMDEQVTTIGQFGLSAPELAPLDEVEAVRAADVEEALTHLLLIAPEETANSAELYYAEIRRGFANLAVLHMSKPQGALSTADLVDINSKTRARIDSARRGFLALAKRDLGVKK